ncbi:flavoprotein [Streptomyces liangshanensis]|uniref:Flavoprotein n=1 Tax=Streptomyces liangshanensis TaxID=2717324 RepID=A0A6G9GZC0_9ACTN|nr:flavoprotein [Streptomyces liangshanensis]QIQ03331.1 flavoprotein [Streptomyces liangshanensis]
MTVRSGKPKPFLYVVVCAAGVAGGVGTLIGAAHARGWAVGVIASPQGLGFLDADAVVARTGFPVRSAWRRPGEPRPLPPPDAIAVAPATFNTVNKWAAGVADTLALGTLCEAYGAGVPTAVLPYLNADLAAHPAYARSLDRLRGMGVLVGGPAPHPAGASGAEDAFRWEEALDLLEPPVFGARGPAAGERG